MCGIVGYIGKNNAINKIIEALEALEYRGYDSCGIAYFKQNNIIIKKEIGRIQNLKNILTNEQSHLGIGHTRWATHGIPNKVNAHPHTQGNITLVHNGIIENYLELKNELIKIGYEFKSETDSEIVAALIDNIYKNENDIIKSLNIASKKIIGSYALAILINNDKDNLYCIRKTSPLVIAINENEKFIASDVPAILKYTNKYILLDDLEIGAIKKDSIVIYDKNLNQVNKEIKTFEGNYDTSCKNGYETFMLKEINEQSHTINETITTYLEQNGFKNLPNFSKYNKIHIIGCGSAYHSGLVAKNLLENFCNIEVTCEIASEYRYEKVFYNEQTLVIAISQSGETADTLAALKKAKEDNIDTLAIVNVVGSSIAREAKYVTYIKAGYEIAVATTKAYTAQMSLLIVIALKIAYEKKIINTEYLKSILKDLDSVPTIIQNLIDLKYEKIALKLYNQKNIFFIGRGIDYYLCLEGALKLKEISYINSVAYQAGELKHGTISLIDEGTYVIAIDTTDNLSLKIISNIKEVKARGAKIIYLTINNSKEKQDFYDIKINIPKINKFIQPILTIIPLQLLAYHVAKLNNCDIDKPRNLAKSVTVE